MANPQQPELARSRKTPGLDPDATEAVLSAEGTPIEGRARGPVPVENQPGHHPPVEQDKPDPDRFVAKVKGVAAAADGAEPATRPEAAPPTATTPPPSPTAEGLATLAGAPWKLASGVLQRLRDRL
jgi:hypothetical protein